MEEHALPAEAREWKGILESHWRAFFGKQAGYYMTQLIRWHQGQLPQFSIAAFFAGFFWMGYRKMYLMIVATIIVLLIEGTIETALLSWFEVSQNTYRGMDLLMTFVFGLAFGTFANRVYLWDARRQIREELAKGPFHIEELILARIAKRGGTSWMFLLVIFGSLALAIIAANSFDLYKAFN